MKTNRWIVQEVNQELQQKLVKELEISPILANLLINRGYSEPEAVRAFLNPSLDNLTSPFALLNMGAAVEKILAAVERQEKIMVYGDYDVDGICASVILYQGLKERQWLSVSLNMLILQDQIVYLKTRWFTQ